MGMASDPNFHALCTQSPYLLPPLFYAPVYDWLSHDWGKSKNSNMVDMLSHAKNLLITATELSHEHVQCTSPIEIL